MRRRFVATVGRRADLLYTTPDQQTRIEVRLDEKTVRLTQREMAAQFQTTVQRAEALTSYQGILDNCGVR